LISTLFSFPLFAQKHKQLEVKNSTIYFRDTSEIDRVFKQLLEYSNEQLDQWEKAAGFTSNRTLVSRALIEFEKAKSAEDFKALLKKHQNLISYSSEDSTLAPIIDNPVIASIANGQGVFFIGKAAYKVKNDKLIMVKNGDLKKLEKAAHTLKNDPKAGVSVSTIKGPVVQAKMASTCQPTNNSIILTKATLRARHYVYLLYWNGNVFLFITSQSQQKIGLAWFPYKSGYHDLQVANVKVNCIGGPITTGGWTSKKYNVKEIYRSWPLPFGNNLSTASIVLVNSKTQIQGIYPYWATMICQ
jgi:hypothetical protein